MNPGERNLQCLFSYRLVGEGSRESQLSSTIPQGSPPSSDERQAYQFVFGQLALGKKDPDIVDLLVTKGIAIDRAQFIV